MPDRGLIEDGTYLVAVADGALVGCGGWSLRRKAYAGPADAADDAGRLDPASEPTRIRAMFTAPDAARRGIGRAILEAAEDGARAAGFRARLGATMSGFLFYCRSGYVEIGREQAVLPDGTRLAVVLREKALRRRMRPVTGRENRMRRLVLVLAAADHGVAPMAVQPSFDCSTASHEIEKLVCKSDTLAGSTTRLLLCLPRR